MHGEKKEQMEDKKKILNLEILNQTVFWGYEITQKQALFGPSKL